MLTFGVLALVFVNQQRDRRRLGLDEAAAFSLEEPGPATGAEAATLPAVAKA
ncbi:hypothetical protein [Arthrobacter sp. PAMC25564]|uniref:hypothetical protein n=1 Tax=Arthrobacter sp. PAMC25564 TaxID=2565366 RepID=UPI00144548BF|nr:hypothetical protein [Arthrobacter sp. PAMC25564]